MLVGFSFYTTCFKNRIQGYRLQSGGKCVHALLFGREWQQQHIQYITPHTVFVVFTVQVFLGCLSEPTFLLLFPVTKETEKTIVKLWISLIV